jgi:delta8-fatty-acid desaturase
MPRVVRNGRREREWSIPRAAGLHTITVLLHIFFLSFSVFISNMGAPINHKWSREQVTARILAGDTLVIYNSLLLRIPQSWLNEHPGGSLAILHFVGRDASDEIDAYHCEDTIRRIQKYVIGTVESGDHGWEPLVPPVMTGWVRKIGKQGQQEWYNEATAVNSPEDTELSPSSQILLVQKDDALLKPTAPNIVPPPTNLSLEVQAEHSAAYKALHKRVLDAGLYKTPYLTGYGPEVARYLLLATISAIAYSHNWLVTSAVFLGLVWHQLVFTAHDLGHMGVTHDWVWDRLLAIFIADFIGGLSIGWWVDVSPSKYMLEQY